MISILNSFNGKFGKFGGSYIHEILFYAVKELETNYNNFTSLWNRHLLGKNPDLHIIHI